MRGGKGIRNRPGSSADRPHFCLRSGLLHQNNAYHILSSVARSELPPVFCGQDSIYTLRIMTKLTDLETLYTLVL